MEITPEMYLNVGDVELRGPSAIRTFGEAEPVAAPAPATLEEVTSALRQAQLRGDTAAVGLLSAQQDDLINGVYTAPEEQPTQNDTTPTEEEVEAPEADPEASPEGFTESAFNKALVNELGGEGADAILATINATGDEAVIEAFLASAQSEDTSYAEEVTSWARLANQAGATPSGELNVEGYTESQIAELQHASSYADEIVSLNQQLVSGQISQAQLFQAVIQEPGLMAEAVKLRAQGLISF